MTNRLLKCLCVSSAMIMFARTVLARAESAYILIRCNSRIDVRSDEAPTLAVAEPGGPVGRGLVWSGKRINNALTLGIAVEMGRDATFYVQIPNAFTNALLPDTSRATLAKALTVLAPQLTIAVDGQPFPILGDPKLIKLPPGEHSLSWVQAEAQKIADRLLQGCRVRLNIQPEKVLRREASTSDNEEYRGHYFMAEAQPIDAAQQVWLRPNAVKVLTICAGANKFDLEDQTFHFNELVLCRSTELTLPGKDEKRTVFVPYEHRVDCNWTFYVYEELLDFDTAMERYLTAGLKRYEIK